MYQLTSNSDFVLNLDDSTLVPVSGTWMSEAYQAWLADGNTPEPVPAPTFEEILAAVEPGIQLWMDSVVQASGYADVVSCATYATSAVAKWKADADAVVAWRDAVWIAAYNWQSGINGQLPATIPTIEDVIEQLPQPEQFGWNQHDPGEQVVVPENPTS